MATKVPAIVDLNEYTTPGLYYRTGGDAEDIINGPQYGGFQSFALTVEYTGRGGNGVIQTVKNAFGQVCMRSYYSAKDISDELVWTEWVRLATANPPQKYDLPLANGYKSYNLDGPNACYYFKTEDNLVYVSVAAHISSGNIISASVFGNLPVGYRPENWIYCAAIGDDYPTGYRQTIGLSCSPDGVLSTLSATLDVTWSRVKMVLGTFIFLAG